jgi:hypothetical protein
MASYGLSKKLIYTTIVASMSQQSDLLDIEKWKNEWRGKSFQEIIRMRKEEIDEDAIDILLNLARLVDRLEEKINWKAEIAGSLGVDSKFKAKVLSEVDHKVAWNFVPVFLMDRLFDAALKERKSPIEVVAFKHPLLRMDKHVIKPNKVTKFLLELSEEDVNKALESIQGLIAIEDKYPGRPQGRSGTLVGGRSARIREVTEGLGESMGREEEREMEPKEVAMIMEDAISYGYGVGVSQQHAMIGQAHRIAANLWLLAASCFYVSKVSVERGWNRLILVLMVVTY